MQKLIKILLFGFFVTLNLNAWEVSTHQALTKLALEGDNRSENMKNNYINEFNLSSISYENYGDISSNVWVSSAFTTYETSLSHYIDVARDLTSQAKLPIASIPSGYDGLFEAGAILEDTAMSTDGIDATNGRFNNHFYDPHRAGCYSLGGKSSRACARDWAKSTENNFKFNNNFSWDSAYEHYYQALKETNEETKKSLQADLFVSLGHISHLVEDMTQAAHVRDDTHPFTNVFETWANRNFNAKNMKSNKTYYSNEITFNPRTFNSIFDETAIFTHNNFYSDDTIDGDLFDGSHPLPSNGITAIRDNDKITEDEDFYYIRSNQLANNRKLAIFEKGFFISDYSLVRTNDYSVLEDNAIHLFPKAIASVEGMINYFFRGKISARIHPTEDNKIIITNRIGKSEINKAVSTVIKSGSTIEIVDKNKGIVATRVLAEDLSNDKSIEIEIPETGSINIKDYTVVLNGKDGDTNQIVAETRIDDKCKVFFTGLVIADHQSNNNISEVYVLDSFSEYVGAGEYPDNTVAFPNAVASTFDGIAIDKGTKITIYSGKNFTGKILYEKVGPAILNNIL